MFLAWLPHPLAAHVEMALASNIGSRKRWDRFERHSYGSILSICFETAPEENCGQRQEECSQYPHVFTSFPPPVRLDSADRQRTMPLHAIFPAASPRRSPTGQ